MTVLPPIDWRWIDSQPDQIDIPGYGGRYYVTKSGQVCSRRSTGDRPLAFMFPSASAGRRCAYVRLAVTRGRGAERHCVGMTTLLLQTYYTHLPAGTVFKKRNGLRDDYSLENLIPTTRQELGKLDNRVGNARTVAKVDPSTGHVVAFYRSAREAGRRNYMSYQTVLDAANRRNKKRPGVAPDGFIYVWEE